MFDTYVSLTNMPIGAIASTSDAAAYYVGYTKVFGAAPATIPHIASVAVANDILKTYPAQTAGMVMTGMGIAPNIGYISTSGNVPLGNPAIEDYSLGVPTARDWLNSAAGGLVNVGLYAGVAYVAGLSTGLIGSAPAVAPNAAALDNAANFGANIAGNTVTGVIGGTGSSAVTASADVLNSIGLNAVDMTGAITTGVIGGTGDITALVDAASAAAATATSAADYAAQAFKAIQDTAVGKALTSAAISKIINATMPTHFKTPTAPPPVQTGGGNGSSNISTMLLLGGAALGAVLIFQH
jgi:hypothetical protein